MFKKVFLLFLFPLHFLFGWRKKKIIEGNKKYKNIWMKMVWDFLTSDKIVIDEGIRLYNLLFSLYEIRKRINNKSLFMHNLWFVNVFFKYFSFATSFCHFFFFLIFPKFYVRLNTKQKKNIRTESFFKVILEIMFIHFYFNWNEKVLTEHSVVRF